MEKNFEDLARRVEELEAEQIKLAEAQAEQKVVFGRFEELQARLEGLEKLPDQVRQGDGKAEHGLNQIQGQVDGLRERVKKLERLEREKDKEHAELKRRVKGAERAAILAKETAKKAEQKMESLCNVTFPFGDESDAGLERRRREDKQPPAEEQVTTLDSDAPQPKLDAQTHHRMMQRCGLCGEMGGHHEACPTQRKDERPPDKEPAEDSPNLELLKCCIHHIRMSATFAEVRQRMARELRRDEGLRIGYVANVAMLLHDRYGITDHATRNQAAEDILNLIFQGWSSISTPLYANREGESEVE